VCVCVGGGTLLFTYFNTFVRVSFKTVSKFYTDVIMAQLNVIRFSFVMLSTVLM
jgi:hypothetical protein